MLIDNLLPFILAKFYKGYSHKTMALSVLGCNQSPAKIKVIYNMWCIVSGIAFFISGYAVFKIFGGGLAIATAVLLAIYGFGCEFLSGIFPVNERKEDKSISSEIHGIGSAIGFTLLIFAPLLLGIMFLNSNEIAFGTISLVCFIFTLISFCFFIMGEKDKFKNTFMSYGGLWQRIVLIVAYIPFIMLCITTLIN